MAGRKRRPYNRGDLLLDQLHERSSRTDGGFGRASSAKEQDELLKIVGSTAADIVEVK
jgi:hypothetical protein